jgi:hypothetical protein
MAGRFNRSGGATYIENRAMSAMKNVPSTSRRTILRRLRDAETIRQPSSANKPSPGFTYMSPRLKR